MSIKKPDGWSWTECEEGRILVERHLGGELVDWFSANSVEAGSHAADILGGLENALRKAQDFIEYAVEALETADPENSDWREKRDALLARLGSDDGVTA